MLIGKEYQQKMAISRDGHFLLENKVIEVDPDNHGIATTKEIFWLVVRMLLQKCSVISFHLWYIGFCPLRHR